MSDGTHRHQRKNWKTKWVKLNKYNNKNFKMWWMSSAKWLIYCWLTISHSQENFTAKGKIFSDFEK